MMRAAPQPSPLVEFKAGMLQKVGTTVTADDRKGIVVITSDPDLNGCAKLKWLDRRSRNTLEELMIFPNDAEWVRVPQATDGRVYVLRFKGSDRRFFFWMQEPSDEKDEEYAKEVNKALGNDVVEEADKKADMDADDAGIATEASVSDVAPGGADNEDAMDTDSPAKTGGEVASSTEMAQLANILGNATRYQQQLQTEQGIDLNDVLSTNTMLSLVDNPQFRDSVLEHMPESAEKTPAEFRALVRSPQFQEALRSFQQALQMGQLGPVMEQFGLDGNDGALGSVQAFVDALAKHAKKNDDSDTPSS